jgi:hypothetical protein
MDRRNFLLAFIGAAAGGVALSSQARAAPANSLWDDLQDLEAAGAPVEDLPAEGAEEAQNRRSRGRGHYRGRRYRGGRSYYRRGPRGRAYGYYRRPRRRYRRRVCRVVRNRYGYLVRRCWWVW